MCSLIGLFLGVERSHSARCGVMYVCIACGCHGDGFPELNLAWGMVVVLYTGKVVKLLSVVFDDNV